MNTLRVLPEAEAEIEASALWYDAKRAGLGAEFLATLDEAFDERRRRAAHRADLA